MTLREPPKKPQASRIAGRFVGLILLLALFALAVWTAATNQQAAAIQRSDPFVHAPGEHLSVRGRVIHAQTFGGSDGVTVLVHDDSIIGGAVLSDLASALADLGQQVVVPDLVGFGFSSRPEEPGRALSTTGQAETLATYLEERGLEAVHLVGFGWGGEVATEVAVTRPDLVASLALVDTPTLPVEDARQETLEGLPWGVGEAFSYTFSGAAPQAESRFVESCPSWTSCQELLPLYQEAAAVPGTARGIWARRASSPAFVATSRLDTLSIPVLVVAVDESEASAEALASQFPEARAVVTDAAELSEVLAG